MGGVGWVPGSFTIQVFDLHQYFIFGSQLFFLMFIDKDICDSRDNSFDDVIQTIVSIFLVWVSKRVIEGVDSPFNSFIQLIDVEDELRQVFNRRFGNFFLEWVNPYIIKGQYQTVV